MRHRALLLALVLFLLAGVYTPVATAQDVVPEPVLNLRNLPVSAGAAVNTATIIPARRSGATIQTSIAYHVTVAVGGTGSTLLVDFGTDWSPVKLNGGDELEADCLYTFTFSATPADRLTFSFGTSTTIVRLIVEEIPGGGR